MVILRPGYDLKTTRYTRGISMKINQWKDSVKDKENLQGKQVDQNKTEIPEPNRGLATSLRKYALKLNLGRMNFNIGVP